MAHDEEATLTLAVQEEMNFKSLLIIFYREKQNAEKTTSSNCNAQIRILLIKRSKK